jgi:hypothetical protein
MQLLTNVDFWIFFSLFAGFFSGAQWILGRIRRKIQRRPGKGEAANLITHVYDWNWPPPPNVGEPGPSYPGAPNDFRQPLVPGPNPPHVIHDPRARGKLTVVVGGNQGGHEQGPSGGAVS